MQQLRNEKIIPNKMPPQKSLLPHGDKSTESEVEHEHDTVAASDQGDTSLAFTDGSSSDVDTGIVGVKPSTCRPTNLT